MQSKRDKKHNGQQPLLNEFDEKNENADRPKGMPSLSEIQTEIKLRSLKPLDGEHIYNMWLSNGYKTSRGTAIKNWRAAIRVWQLNNWFPSQRNLKNRTATQDHNAQSLRRLYHGNDAA